MEPRRKDDTERDEEIATTLQKSAQAQDEAATVLRQVAHRLDRLSAEMRKHGAFPIAGQLDRERERLERQANVVINGR